MTSSFANSITRYHKQYSYARSSAIQFAYHCAQLDAHQAESQKVPDQSKHWDRLFKDAYSCGGWLKITIDDSSSALVELNHEVNHDQYWPTEIPEEIQERIQEYTKKGWSPTQVCHKIYIYSAKINFNLLDLDRYY